MHYATRCSPHGWVRSAANRPVQSARIIFGGAKKQAGKNRFSAKKISDSEVFEIFASQPRSVSQKRKFSPCGSFFAWNVRMKKLLPILLLFLALLPARVHALGIRLWSEDAEAAARGSAFVATADDPGAIYYNPAGITQL